MSCTAAPDLLPRLLRHKLAHPASHLPLPPYQQGVPVNELHGCGYDSIGCEPCTRPVLPNQQEREGRWWWEDEAAKECGLHSGNISSASGDEESKQDNDLWQGGAGGFAFLCIVYHG